LVSGTKGLAGFVAGYILKPYRTAFYRFGLAGGHKISQPLTFRIALPPKKPGSPPVGSDWRDTCP